MRLDRRDKVRRMSFLCKGLLSTRHATGSNPPGMLAFASDGLGQLVSRVGQQCPGSRAAAHPPDGSAQIVSYYLIDV
jgi:hypothetical protein